MRRSAIWRPGTLAVALTAGAVAALYLLRPLGGEGPAREGSATPRPLRDLSPRELLRVTTPATAVAQLAWLLARDGQEVLGLSGDSGAWVRLVEARTGLVRVALEPTPGVRRFLDLAYWEFGGRRAWIELDAGGGAAGTRVSLFDEDLATPVWSLELPRVRLSGPASLMRSRLVAVDDRPALFTWSFASRGAGRCPARETLEGDAVVGCERARKVFMEADQVRLDELPLAAGGPPLLAFNGEILALGRDDGRLEAYLFRAGWSLLGSWRDSTLAAPLRAIALDRNALVAGDAPDFAFAGAAGPAVVGTLRWGGLQRLGPAAGRGEDRWQAISVGESGRLAATGTAGGSVRLWDLETGAAVASVETGAPVTALAISGDGRLLAVGGRGGATIYALAP